MDWLHIDSWLSTMYKGHKEGVPYFERTNKNYEILNNLKKLNFNSTELVESIIIHLNNNSNSGGGRGEMIQSDNKLSETGQDALESLALIAQLFGLGTTELSNYYTAISRLSIDQMEMEMEESTLNEIEYTLNEYQKGANEELNNMRGILNKLRGDNSQMINQKRIFVEEEGTTNQLKQKTSEYLLLEKKYNDLGIERKGTRLKHIHELDLKANSIENELKEKSDILTSYQVLPSEMLLASIKIQETQDQLHELENERENLLGHLGF